MKTSHKELRAKLVASGILDPVPDCGLDACKAYALEHVDRDELDASHMMKALMQLSLADVMLALTQWENNGREQITFHELTRERFVRPFQGSGDGAAFYPGE